MYKYDVFAVVNLFLNYMYGVILLNSTEVKKLMQSLHVNGDCRGGIEYYALVKFQKPPKTCFRLVLKICFDDLFFFLKIQ